MTMTETSAPIGVVVTEEPGFRMLWPNLFEPRAFDDKGGGGKGEPKYGLVMLFDPGPHLDALKRVAARVAREKWPGRSLKELRFPFKNGSTQAEAAQQRGRDGAFYEGKVVVKASSKYKPPVVGLNRQPVLSADEVYSGRWGYAELNFVAYDGVGGGQPGVTAYVNHVMLGAHGDRIAGRTSEQVFAGIRGHDTQDDPAPADLDDEIPF